jgi:putative ABC transport system substrate-binding protein
MRRREFIAGLGGAAALPFAANAQASGKVARIGVLWHAGSAEEERDYLTVLVRAFADLGYVEGKNVEFLHKFPAEQPERFRTLAKELVESNVDLLIAVTTAGGYALKQFTSRIPIVLLFVTDPISTGFVSSLAHPGGNMTGLSLVQSDLSGKRLALLKEAVPNLSVVALLLDPQLSGLISANATAAKTLGLSLRPIEIQTPDVIEPAFAEIEKEQIGGAVVVGASLYNQRARVGASALAHKVPTIGQNAEMVPYGLLMSYGVDAFEYFRKAAWYGDQILRGANPADLPVQQPTRLKHVINLKAARALGLHISPQLQQLADEVIE